jgi:Mitochondrial carrier protein
MARNRVQSGLVHESLTRYILSGRGIKDTAPYLVPFMLVSAPHDLGELLTVTNCNRLVESYLCHLRLPRELLDAGSGALAGVAGVMLSAPMDCVKTKMVTAATGTQFGRPDLCWSTAGVRAKWLAAARFTWRTQGVRGFFVGILPRLIDEVPGATLHWMLVEATLRALP